MIFPKASATTVNGKGITLTSALGTQKRSQKTSVGLDNLHAGDCDWGGGG